MGRVVVVGGGAAGILSALFLARLGNSVTVVEKMPHTAPLIRGFSRGGMHFDTGFHYAGGLEAGRLAHYLDVLGVAKRLVRAPLAPSGGELLRFGGKETDVPIARGCVDFIRSLAAESPGAEAVAADFLGKNRELARSSPYLFPTGQEFDPYRLHSDSPTLEAAFDAMAIAPRLRMILGFRCLLYGVHPSQANVRDFALVNDAFIDDAAVVVGGGRALAEAFDGALADSGVAVRTNCEASGIVLGAGNAVAGVRIRDAAAGSTETLDADACVYSGAPRALARLLPDGAIRPAFAKRLSNAKETGKPLMIFAATKSDFFRRKQIFCCPDASYSFDRWFPAQYPSAGCDGKYPFYISGGDGRNGRWPITALTPIGNDATAAWSGEGRATGAFGYESYKRETAKIIREQMLVSCPEFSGDLDVVEIATDVSLRRWSFNSSGSLYGMAHETGTVPILPVTRVDGLVLAGQNVLLPGLLGVAVSAAVAAGALAGSNRISELLL